jgi:hypothetical protein
MVKRSLLGELRNELMEAERRVNALRAALGALTGIRTASAPAGRRGRRPSTRTGTPRKKRRISAAGRRRISEAQKARWAKQKAAQKR